MRNGPYYDLCVMVRQYLADKHNVNEFPRHLTVEASAAQDEKFGMVMVQIHLLVVI